MVESWNAGIQRELTSNLALEIRYQANHGVGLTDQFSLNEVNIFENGFLNEFNNAGNQPHAVAKPTQRLAFAAWRKKMRESWRSRQLQRRLRRISRICLLLQPMPAQVRHLPQAAHRPSQHWLAKSRCRYLQQLSTPVLLRPRWRQLTTSASVGNQTPRSGTPYLSQDLGLGGAGSLANSLGGSGLTTSAANFTSFLANLQSAGFPSNFFVVNPTATGGSFITTNGAQSTYNALIVDLRHRPSHGLQFDVSYTCSRSHLPTTRPTAR